eukprot:55503-Prorocentrum_minimum.AAC.1
MAWYHSTNMHHAGWGPACYSKRSSPHTEQPCSPVCLVQRLSLEGSYQRSLEGKYRSSVDGRQARLRARLKAESSYCITSDGFTGPPVPVTERARRDPHEHHERPLPPVRGPIERPTVQETSTPRRREFGGYANKGKHAPIYPGKWRGSMFWCARNAPPPDPLQTPSEPPSRPLGVHNVGN